MAASWQLIPCLRRLFMDFNAAAPGRDKASDGSIGDTAHQQETSDHNPDETGSVPIHDADLVNEVHAIDVDDDLRTPGLTMEMCVQHILGRCRSGAEKRLRYIIYSRRIWDYRSGWVQKAYTGPSPHTEHAHFSASYDTAHEANTASWDLEELNPMAIETADIAKIAAATRDLIFATEVEDSADPATPNRKLTFRVWQQYEEGRHLTTRAVIIAAINAAAGVDHVDEAAIVAGVLAGLPAEKIAAAIPPGLAAAVVNELRDRLDATGPNS